MRDRHPQELLEGLRRAACLLWGHGRPRFAFKLFLLLAEETGDDTAQLSIGFFYDHGVGVRRNKATAMQWYRRAYRSGSAMAAINIGLVFRERGQPRAALRWFHRALAKGETEAALNIAQECVVRGRDTAAAPYLRMVVSAKKGDVCEASREEAAAMLRQIQSVSARPRAARRR